MTLKNVDLFVMDVWVACHRHDRQQIIEICLTNDRLYHQKAMTLFLQASEKPSGTH
jgi:hypothetical protein